MLKYLILILALLCTPVMAYTKCQTGERVHSVLRHGKVVTTHDIRCYRVPRNYYKHRYMAPSHVFVYPEWRGPGHVIHNSAHRGAWIRELQGRGLLKRKKKPNWRTRPHNMRLFDIKF